VSESAPGTVAVATVNGCENTRVFRRSGYAQFGKWIAAEPGVPGGSLWVDEWDIADIRPLVVLDAPQVDLLTAATFLRNGGWGALADQIEEQTKPTRIPEPGRWGVVEAGIAGGVQRWHYVRRADDGYWYTLRGAQRRWDELIDPVLIREGVES
jgi:hypothetical protein